MAIESTPVNKLTVTLPLLKSCKSRASLQSALGELSHPTRSIGKSFVGLSQFLPSKSPAGFGIQTSPSNRPMLRASECITSEPGDIFP